ncbi:MAG: hypothetical protein R3Y33_03615 [Clostridia bacterium]
MSSQNTEKLNSTYFLSYIPFLFLLAIPHIKKTEGQEKRFLKLHYKQGKILSIIGIVIFLLDNINAYILINFLPFLAYIIIGYVLSVAWILWLSLIIKGMLNTVKGKHKPLPLFKKITRGIL